MPLKDKPLTKEQKELLAMSLVVTLNSNMWDKRFNELRDKVITLALTLDIPLELDKELDNFIATKNQRFYN